MQPFGPMKAEQIAFNERVSEQAKGLLAPLSGRECTLSIGCGHFAGWVRAIKAGCRTPYKELADDHGNLCAERFARKDKRMGTCISKGWQWKEFKFVCDIAWPGLADLGQRALNASHGVSSRSTEIELMCWFVDAETGKAMDSTYDDIVSAALLVAPRVHRTSEPLGNWRVRLVAVQLGLLYDF